jgi:hypothetical protein
MTALVRYEAARSALQAAASVDEVKDIRDKAQAMAAYARQAKDTQLQAWAAEIKIRAERKAGEMLKEMDKNRGGNPEQIAKSNRSSPTTGSNETPSPKLSDLGISKDNSSRWQKLAEIPEEDFERKIVELKQNPERVTTTSIIREQREAERAQSGEMEPAKKPRPPEDALEKLRDKQVGRHPDAELSREEVEADISGEEIELERRLAKANAERVAILLESDDALAELVKKNEELSRINATLQIRINQLMDENAGAVVFSKSQNVAIKKLKKENAALKEQLAQLQSDAPETFEF